MHKPLTMVKLSGIGTETAPCALLVMTLFLSLFALASAQQVVVLRSPSEDLLSGRFGNAVAIVLDVNGNGSDDIAVGAPGEDGPGGKVHLFDGKTLLLIKSIVSPSATPDDEFGEYIAAMGDMNGNGAGDFVVNVEKPEDGLVYLFDGATGSILRVFRRPAPGRSETPVAALPDADGDGVLDVVAASPFAEVEDFASAGAVYGYSGANGAVLHTLISPDPERSGWFGHSVAGVTDMDGDGFGDVLVGAPGEDGNELKDSGRVYLFSGATGQLLDTFVSPNAQARHHFGTAVSVIDDITGDGTDEFAIDSNVGGFAYVYDGVTREIVTHLAWTDQELGHFSSVPDLTGDGIADILLGKDQNIIVFESEPPLINASSPAPVYVYDGASGERLGTLFSDEEYDNFGGAVAGLADINGDNLGEIVVGAPGSRSFDSGNRVYVFLSPVDFSAFGREGEGEGEPDGEAVGEGEGQPEEEGEEGQPEGDREGDGEGGTEGEGEGEGGGEDKSPPLMVCRSGASGSSLFSAVVAGDVWAMMLALAMLSRVRRRGRSSSA